MRKYFLILIVLTFPTYRLFAQVPTGQLLRQKAHTTEKGKSVPKRDKYDPKAHEWPKKDSLKRIEKRKSPVRKMGKRHRVSKRFAKQCAIR